MFKGLSEMKAFLACIIIFYGMTQDMYGQKIKVAETVKLDWYAGQWYEIASNSHRFQKGCRCTTTEFEMITGHNAVRVINRCIRFNGNRSKVSVFRGKAFVAGQPDSTKFKVQFFWPFREDYIIIALAYDGSWALVGHPTGKYLWILSREAFMPSYIYDQILELVKQKGYDPKKLLKTPQNCDNPR
jgi:apolipoprotein D and lipocalin family protein